MLGELYKPKGEALETAQAVLETENVYACNVAKGCCNACSYCYIPQATRGAVKRGMISYPKEPTYELVKKQLHNGVNPEGVFLSFLTDPFIKPIAKDTMKLIELLQDYGIEVAVLTKLEPPAVIDGKFLRFGMSIVSSNRKFWRHFEMRTASPIVRYYTLNKLHKAGFYTWLSVEPVPPPAIWKQDLIKQIEPFYFVDFMIFGKWNYDKRASDEKARNYYAETIPRFIDFCKDHGIRYHVKKATMEFALGRRDKDAEFPQ